MKLSRNNPLISVGLLAAALATTLGLGACTPQSGQPKAAASRLPNVGTCTNVAPGDSKIEPGDDLTPAQEKAAGDYVRHELCRKGFRVAEVEFSQVDWSFRSSLQLPGCKEVETYEVDARGIFIDYSGSDTKPVGDGLVVDDTDVILTHWPTKAEAKKYVLCNGS